jgi:hypothetical protein
MKPRADVAAQRIAIFATDVEIGGADAPLGETGLTVVVVV